MENGLPKPVLVLCSQESPAPTLQPQGAEGGLMKWHAQKGEGLEGILPQQGLSTVSRAFVTIHMMFY